MSIYVYTCVYMCAHLYIYIYIYREREREIITRESKIIAFELTLQCALGNWYADNLGLHMYVRAYIWGIKVLCCSVSWKPCESEAHCTRPWIINKAPNHSVRIIPEANLHGTASGYLAEVISNSNNQLRPSQKHHPDKCENLPVRILSGDGESQPWHCTAQTSVPTLSMPVCLRVSSASRVRNDNNNNKEIMNDINENNNV